MPIYDLKNNDTGEVFEEMMSISALEKYLEENPHIVRYHSTINFMDEVSIGRKKPDGQWFDLMDKIKRNNPGNTLDQTSRFKRPREF